MTEKKQFHLKIKWKNMEKTEAHEIVLYDGGQPICELISVDDARLVRDVLNEQEETIQELLKYKYLVKALEEVSRGDIGEIIYDYAGEGYEDEKSQLELGKICSEQGLSWEDSDVDD